MLPLFRDVVKVCGTNRLYATWEEIKSHRCSNAAVASTSLSLPPFLLPHSLPSSLPLSLLMLFGHLPSSRIYASYLLQSPFVFVSFYLLFSLYLPTFPSSNSPSLSLLIFVSFLKLCFHLHLSPFTFVSLLFFQSLYLPTFPTSNSLSLSLFIFVSLSSYVSIFIYLNLFLSFSFSFISPYVYFPFSLIHSIFVYFCLFFKLPLSVAIY